MRLIARRLHRAFPELDRLSDEQAMRIVQRVRDTIGGVATTRFVPIVAFFLSIVVLAPVPSVLDRLLWRVLGGWEEEFFVLCLLVVFVVTPPILAFLVRDAMLQARLRAGLRAHLDRTSCLDCRYVLVGRTPIDGRVRCPECGREQSLAELGATEADLLIEPGA